MKVRDLLSRPRTRRVSGGKKSSVVQGLSTSMYGRVSSSIRARSGLETRLRMMHPPALMRDFTTSSQVAILASKDWTSGVGRRFLIMC